jgi:DNA-directed RNA polymerase specialized sigma24 family protein
MTTNDEDPTIALYRESFPDFARMVRRKGGSLEQAKDCFHDAMLIYLERARTGKLQLRSSPNAYLLGTARIRWLQTIKKDAMLRLSEGFDVAEPEAADTTEREQGLLSSLAASGTKCLELLKAFYYDHFSMDDIAVRFGFSGRRSATVQKYKCLEKVRDNIAKMETYAQ